MDRRKLLGLILFVFILVLAACGQNDANNTTNNSNNDGGKSDQSKLQVVASFTIISDMANEIGGDLLEIHNLVPTGIDPHEYEPKPDDIKHATDADVLLYNGLNLEGGEKGWFFRLIDTVGQPDEKVFETTEGVTPLYLEDDTTNETEINPHAFIDPNVGVQMAKNIQAAFIEVDPENEAHYQENGDDYIKRLEEMEDEYADKLDDIPENHRHLVTSECAYQYLNERYGFEESCIWKVDTEENGSPQQITALIDKVKSSDVPVLFVESNVDPRPMETVSKESGVPIYDKPIYSDEIGKKGDEVDTYMKYLKYNLKIIYDGLK